jgi:hypothetical protein
MPEMEIEQSGVVPAVPSDIASPQDQKDEKTDEPITKPQTGRLPARASRGKSG